MVVGGNEGIDEFELFLRVDRGEKGLGGGLGVAEGGIVDIETIE